MNENLIQVPLKHMSNKALTSIYTSVSKFQAHCHAAFNGDMSQVDEADLEYCLTDLFQCANIQQAIIIELRRRRVFIDAETGQIVPTALVEKQDAEAMLFEEVQMSHGRIGFYGFTDNFCEAAMADTMK